MLRPDFLYLLPALLIALLQAKIIWPGMPGFDDKDTEIQGGGEEENLYLSYLKYAAYALFWAQLVFVILPISQEHLLFLRLFGYLLILSGFTISYKALKDLGKNWTGMSDFRIKKGQELVKSGVYKTIRHPIYLAVILEIVGFELLANSWLFLPMLIALLIVFNNQINKEEKLLKIKFKEEFVLYSQKTKKLMPLIY